jgi:C4-type Zn-finger protein
MFRFFKKEEPDEESICPRCDSKVNIKYGEKYRNTFTNRLCQIKYINCTRCGYETTTDIVYLRIDASGD